MAEKTKKALSEKRILPPLTLAPASGDPAADGAMHEKVYAALRHALIVGRLSPGKRLSLRGLAAAVNAGMTPAREAIRRLCAEHALEIDDNRRVLVPQMTQMRFDELMQARLLLEPACALRALLHIDHATLEKIRQHDRQMNESYASGDAEIYMAANHAFHFEIYRAGGGEVLVPLLESVWMQFGPFMRTVYGMVGETNLVDKHDMAIQAIARRDGEALALAIEADIRDGMDFLGRSIFARDLEPLSPIRRPRRAKSPVTENPKVNP